ncbi:hypothetical protein DY023_08105 [Microbacterium bovistercoris]|uniref:Peptidase M23 n=1 Tax=Microbacterium bovistercoris TaxID=2293570 RepID=A0A371NU86_9MICO|nr:hypothetical protein [Microbacterium bovistercoris]REJ05897.1 hypothetical protein DY023_08105 [Microbacterium bovistercoris]
MATVHATRTAPTKPTRRRPARRRPSRANAARRRTTRSRARARRLRGFAIGGLIAAVAALLVMVPLRMAEPPSLCAADPASFPATGVAGWHGDQLENAATIVRTASALGFARDGQILGVMTAMGESSLHNIDYGDWETRGFTNPDGSRTTSIGLFQQQTWWGSVETRMDPAGAAGLFYAKLAKLDGWQSMPPTQAIHRVQVNTDRDYYAQFEDDATRVVDALSGECA